MPGRCTIVGVACIPALLNSIRGQYVYASFFGGGGLGEGIACVSNIFV